jgi:hypothetical protein
VLETAPSEVASRFPRNCRASQPVSKPWKLPIFSSRAARAPARQSACTCRSHILPVCGLHVGWGAVYTVPVILFTHTENYMYLSDRSHRTAGCVAAAHVHVHVHVCALRAYCRCSLRAVSPETGLVRYSMYSTATGDGGETEC